MSKRFGRNQRRRMRERIAASELLLEMQQKTIKEQRMLMQENRETVRRVAEVLGKRFAALPVTKMDGGHSSRIPDRLRMESISLIERGSWLSNATQVVNESLKYLELPVMETTLRELQGVQHVRVYYGGCEKVGYAISESAFHSLPERDLVEMVSKELATHLVREMKQENRS